MNVNYTTKPSSWSGKSDDGKYTIELTERSPGGRVDAVLLGPLGLEIRTDFESEASAKTKLTVMIEEVEKAIVAYYSRIANL